ncbi:MAG: bifunctional 2',3'-cyclic-nucleotide 2'-phosphodiesterase/3'-nucleotidase [Gemmobacter sp.]
MDFTPPATAPTDGDAILLRILATSDLHAHVHPYDYRADRASDASGLARTASLIHRMRQGPAASVLLDNGDFLQGCPLGDHGADDPQAETHPVIAAMNALGYDAATLGNHEFNRGLPWLQTVLARAAFPVVSANAQHPGGPNGPQPLLPPFVVIDRDLPLATGGHRRLRLGVIGFLPPQTAIWDAHLLREQVETTDILTAARLWLPRLRAAGADVVVALSHSGIGAPDAAPGAEDASTALAGLQGIDAIVTGHSHLVFPSDTFRNIPGVDADGGTVAGIPAVMPGVNGSHLGVIDLWLRPLDEGWTVAGARSAVHPIARRVAGAGLVAQVADRSEVITATATAHAATLARMRRVIGRTPVALTSHFAMVSDGPALRVVATAQRDTVARALRGTALEALPILSAAAPFRSGGRGGPESFTSIAAGPLERRHVDDLYCFPNRLCAVRILGRDVAEWLERSAAAYQRLRPGVTDQPLLNPAFPGYNFDTILGVTYRIDPTAPPRHDLRGTLIDPDARRVRGLRFRGQPLIDEMEFIVVTNSYRLATWDREAMATAQEVPLPAMTVQDLMVDWIAAGNTPAHLETRAWQLVLPPGTSVTIDTAPGADPAELQGSGIVGTSLGQTPDGFRRIRLAPVLDARPGQSHGQVSLHMPEN